MGIAATLAKISQAGFVLTVEGGALMVEPFSRLRDDQAQWLRHHKPEIIAALLASVAAGGNDLTPANDPLAVERALPADLVQAALAVCKAYGDGKAAQDELLDDLRHYPPQHYPALAEHFRAKLTPVRCMDCHHARIDGGIAHCKAGVESGLPVGGYWATDTHPCPWHFKSRDPPAITTQ